MLDTIPVSDDDATYEAAYAPASRSLHVVFAGGGTGGHLFPGLAVAEYLRRLNPQMRITFAGTGSSFEQGQVSRAAHEYLAVRCRPLALGPWQTVRFLHDNLAGYCQAVRYLQEQAVSVVVGLGGYASVPTAKAALRLGVPLVLLEQNVAPGRATAWLAPSAAAVCTSFAATRDHLRPSTAVRFTGNPLRREFSTSRVPGGPCRQAPARRSETFRLLVLGGSGGSEPLNSEVPKALYKLRPRLGEWQIVHQAGAEGLDATRELYRKLGLKAVVVPFVEKMAFMLAETDLAVTRAGGTTLAELAASGVPAVLVPYPAAVDDHQRKNADVFAAAGAGLIVDPREVSGRFDSHLAGELAGLLLDTLLRKRMGEAMRGLARLQATQQVAGAVIEAAQACRLSVAG